MGISEPKQLRSRATMQRFISAALRLVEEKRWDDITIAELVRAARSSVGAFYTRFGDKETLLGVLDNFYADTLCEHFRAFSGTPPTSLSVSATDLFNRLVEFHTVHRGLARTLVLTARSTDNPLYAANSRRINRQLPAVTERLAQCSDLPAGCNREHLAQAMAFTYSAMREQLLFSEAVPVKLKSQRQLMHALTASFVATVHALVRI